MNRTEKCFICGRSTENGLDVCPDCFSRLPDCCKEKYTKLTQEEKNKIFYKNACKLLDFQGNMC